MYAFAFVTLLRTLLRNEKKLTKIGNRFFELFYERNECKL